MKFLVDRCAGRLLATWLRQQGHDVLESRQLGDDPGDLALLRIAVEQSRIVITIDSDFGILIFRDTVAHSGVIRLPDVPPAQRIFLMELLFERHHASLAAGAVVTVRGERIRISR